MDSASKAGVLFVAFIAVLIFGAGFYSAYSKNACIQELAKSSRSADDIKKLCQ